MTPTTKTDRALLHLYRTWLRCQHTHRSIRHGGKLGLEKALGSVRNQVLILPEYQAARNGAICHWAIKRDECRLVLLIRFVDRALPGGFHNLAVLEAIAQIIFNSLGIQQLELVGCDWKGLRVTKRNGWIMEAIA